MKIFDEKIKEHRDQYIKQCLLGTGLILMIIFALEVDTHTVIIATLGATTFIVFGLPHSYASDPRRIFGGYAIGLLIGLVAYYIKLFFLYIDPEGFEGIDILMGALAIGASIFLMVFTNTEHPPAAGLSVGLLFNPWGIETILVVIAAVTVLNVSKYFLRNWLIDLHGPSDSQVEECEDINEEINTTEEEQNTNFTDLE